jgi:hypothetical protein
MKYLIVFLSFFCLGFETSSQIILKNFSESSYNAQPKSIVHFEIDSDTLKIVKDVKK